MAILKLFICISPQKGSNGRIEKQKEIQDVYVENRLHISRYKSYVIKSYVIMYNKLNNPKNVKINKMHK
jgi:hypothetical protein